MAEVDVDSIPYLRIIGEFDAVSSGFVRQRTAGGHGGEIDRYLHYLRERGLIETIHVGDTKREVIHNPNYSPGSGVIQSREEPHTIVLEYLQLTSEGRRILNKSDEITRGSSSM